VVAGMLEMMAIGNIIVKANWRIVGRIPIG